MSNNEEYCPQPTACAQQFGSIQAAMKRTETDRKELKVEIEGLRKEIHSLTGNGNKGRIDELSDKLTALSAEFHESKKHGFAFHDKQEKRMDDIEGMIEMQGREISKMGSELAILSIKIGIPFIAAISLIQWLILRTATAGGLGPNEMELLRQILEKAGNVS